MTRDQSRAPRGVQRREACTGHALEDQDAAAVESQIVAAALSYPLMKMVDDLPPLLRRQRLIADERLREGDEIIHIRGGEGRGSLERRDKPSPSPLQANDDREAAKQPPPREGHAPPRLS